MMATYFRAVPREVFEAATLDGASMIRAFFSIGFPMVRNAVFTVALVQFFFIWNDLLIALTFTNNAELRTIQVGLLNFTGEFGADAVRPALRRDLHQRLRHTGPLPLPEPARHEGPRRRRGQRLGQTLAHSTPTHDPTYNQHQEQHTMPTTVKPATFDHLREALGVGSSTPRISWKTVAGPGWTQAAYQVETTSAGNPPHRTHHIRRFRAGPLAWPAAELT